MDKLETATIKQHKLIQGKYEIVYTTIWHGFDFELWAHVKGYGKTIFLYGADVDDAEGKNLNCVYAPLTDEQLEELTGEAID